ncbi:MAG TPA: sugar phosphate isomerase/epimerase [Gemmatimonadaceae bacterium]|jgi:sugar phosphate isomerase/epimerase
MPTRIGVPNESETTRRGFIKGVAIAAGGLALTSRAGTAFGSTLSASARAFTTPNWADQIGLELYTVRDLTGKDYLGTLEKVAAIGYKEIEPAGGYNNMTPKQFRAEIDRLGLRMPSTHSGVTIGSAADMEQQLAGFQIMGIEYASLDAPRPPGGQGRGRGGRGPAPTSPAAQRQAMAQFIRANAQARTVDDVKQEAARYNNHGKIAQKFGIKLLIHNHTVEFIPCKDADQLPYTILLAETDPALVVFQMDIGWASVAGQNPIQLFQQHPGRFALWHVKDVAGLKFLPPVPDQGGRMAEARLVPVGNGDIDYGEIFKYANVAGMKHFAIEQDSAADWGDSIAAARVSYDHLRAILTERA